MNKRTTKGPSPARTQRAGGEDEQRGKVIKNAKRARASEQPGWAMGLRQLYDAVVDEPLPPSFSDLISQLDSKN